VCVANLKSAQISDLMLAIWTLSVYVHPPKSMFYISDLLWLIWHIRECVVSIESAWWISDLDIINLDYQCVSGVLTNLLSVFQILLTHEQF